MKSKKWLGFDFQYDGWSENHENKSTAFEQWVRDTRSDLRTMLKGTGWELHSWKGNWFTASGFLFHKEWGQWVYISVSDLRYWQDAWWDGMLIRTAENEKDFTGGCNQYCTFSDIREKLQKMFASY